MYGGELTEDDRMNRLSLLPKISLFMAVLMFGGGCKHANILMDSSPAEIQTIMLPGDVPLVMVWIPGGTFLMGRYSGEQGSWSDEDPQHQVTVPGFWMGKYEVTQAQRRALLGKSPSYFAGDSRPAELVSWFGAKSFITALNNHSGKTFRLPSEAEWEYACRAGKTTRFYWGDDTGNTDIVSYAWYRDNSGYQTHDVGGKTANAFGLHDMSGNVLEWCEDDWHDNYTGAPTGGHAWVDSPRGSRRVLRGGGWSNFGNFCRSANRGNDTPDSPHITYGFRVAWTPRRPAVDAELLKDHGSLVSIGWLSE